MPLSKLRLKIRPTRAVKARPDDHAQLLELAAKVEALTKALHESEKLQKRRRAEDLLLVRSCQTCLNTIKDDTQVFMDMKEDAEHTLRLARVLKKPLFWVARHVFLPLGYVVGAGYLVFSGDWPEWIETIKELLAEGE